MYVVLVFSLMFRRVEFQANKLTLFLAYKVLELAFPPSNLCISLPQVDKYAPVLHELFLHLAKVVRFKNPSVKIVRSSRRRTLKSFFTDIDHYLALFRLFAYGIWNTSFHCELLLFDGFLGIFGVIEINFPLQSVVHS